MRDHPDIESAERTGYGVNSRQIEPVCPVCGKECDTVYMRDGEIIGCEYCIECRPIEETIKWWE